MEKINTYNYTISFLIILLGLFLGFFIVLKAQADNIVYPIAGLGNCVNQEDCKNYCNIPEHFDECTKFAKEHNLISDEEVEKAEKIKEFKEGPGGCQTIDECKKYCDNPIHIEECVSFAEENDLLPEEDLKEAKSVIDALKKGVAMPGGCKSVYECKEYCDDPAHIEECVNFAEAAKLIPPEELNKAKGFVNAIKSGIKPPGNCLRKSECEEYCKDPAHVEECLSFAEKAGLIPSEELEKVKRILPLMKEGGMPGGCMSKEECEDYCSKPENTEECADVFIKAGIMSPKEAEMFKKTGGRGPGGCIGEECKDFCNNPANSQICFEFAKEHGLISADELKMIEEDINRIRNELNNASPEILDCFKSNIGEDVLEKIKNNEFMPGPEIRDLVRECFEKFGPRFENGPPEENFPEGKYPPPGEFLGPGGCKGADECRKYCEDPNNREECEKFKPPSGQEPPGFNYEELKDHQLEKDYKPEEGFHPEFKEDLKKGIEGLKEMKEEFYEKFKERIYPPMEKGTMPEMPEGFDPVKECKNRGGEWIENKCEGAKILDNKTGLELEELYYPENTFSESIYPPKDTTGEIPLSLPSPDVAPLPNVPPIEDRIMKCKSEGGVWDDATGNCIFENQSILQSLQGFILKTITDFFK